MIRKVEIEPLEGVSDRTNEPGGTHLLSAVITGRCGNGTVLGSRNASRLVEELYAGDPHVQFCEGVAPRKWQGRLYSTHNRFDGSWDRWFKRIGSWGKINILYVSPEQRKREYISQEQFLVLIDTPNMLQVYEKFQVEQSNIHKFEIWCRYIGKDGREYKDIIQFNVELIPKLQKNLSWWQKIF